MLKLFLYYHLDIILISVKASETFVAWTILILLFLVIRAIRKVNRKNKAVSRIPIPSSIRINMPYLNNISVPKEEMLPESQECLNWKEQMVLELESRNSLSDLLIIKKIDEIYYGDLLNCFEWRFKRLEILVRDEFKCMRCNSHSESNHVHHKYYVTDRFPWHIDNSGLETLCRNCHKQVHENEEIPIKAISQSGNLYITKHAELICSKCGGHGYIPEYAHIQGGICFKCWGHKARNEIFKNPLSITYQYIDNYDDKGKRDSYKKFINNLEYDLIKSVVPNVHVKPEVKMNNQLTYNPRTGKYYQDDDLPF